MKLSVKLAVITGSLLLSVVSGQASSGIKSGFYAGASVGLSHLSGTQKFEALNNPGGAGPIGLTDGRNNALSATSPGIGVFGGYGHRINCTWIAAELSYFLDRLDANRTARFSVPTADKKFLAQSKGGAFGAALHFGYIPHPNFVVYGIAALDVRRFYAGFSNDAFGADPHVNDSVPPISKKYTSFGFAPGIGVLLKLTPNFSIKGEYKYALHRAKTMSTGFVPSQAVPGDLDQSTVKHSPRIQTLQVGIVYNF